MIAPALETTNLITPLIKAYKALSNEWKHLFDIGISDYLHSQTEKYYYTNTFIHRNEKVRFFDIYYPVKAQYRLLTTDFEHLDEIFENYNNITIVGSAGSGKTTLLKYIFLNSIKSTRKIPLLIELRHLNDYNGNIEQLISEKILKSKIKPSEDTYKRALESGRFLFLFDGYDEIFSNKKQEINRQIETFLDSYSKNNSIITTRPGSGIERFPRCHDFKVCDLSNEDVTGFIKKIVPEKERLDRILKITDGKENANYIEYLRNPLLLSMFIMAFENHPEIPSKKSSFYENVFDTLYSKHDGITKNSFPREKMTKFQKDDFEKILNIFCYISMIEGQYSFTEEYLSNKFQKVKKITELQFSFENLIYDLQTTISLLVLDGFEYHFPHRSLQEYFTAKFICELPSEKKPKAYANLSHVMEGSSTDQSFNLWNICHELDEAAFIANFLLPHLENMKEKLSIKDDKALLDSYLKMIYPSFVLERSKTGDSLAIYRTFNFHSTFVNYFNIYNYKDFAYFPARTGAQNELLKLNKIKIPAKISNDFEAFPTSIDGSPKYKAILLKYGVADLLKGYQKSISKKIEYYKGIIEKRKNNIDDLLGD